MKLFYNEKNGFREFIIPMQNPYFSKIGDKIMVKVLFNGEPLKDKMIVTWNKIASIKTRQQN
jgi:uncharacterized GH25 family protein